MHYLYSLQGLRQRAWLLGLFAVATPIAQAASSPGTAAVRPPAALGTAPVLTGSAGPVAAPERVATVVDAGLTLTAAGAPLTSATVQVAGSFISAEDALVFNPGTAPVGPIEGSYAAATGTLSLTVAVGRVATAAQWQAALRAVAYYNASHAPSTAFRTVSFVVSDGSQVSQPASRTVAVTAVNDAPINTAPAVLTTGSGAALALGNTLAVVDADAGTAVIQVSLMATNGTLTLGNDQANSTLTLSGPLTALNAALGSLRFLPTPGFQGQAGLTLVSNDLGNTGTGGPLMATSTVAITVLPVAPTDLPAGMYGSAYSQGVGVAGSPQPCTYAITAGTLPVGLRLLPATGVLMGMPKAIGSFGFTVTAQSTPGRTAAAASQTYALRVLPPTSTTWTGDALTSDWFDDNNWSAGAPGASMSVVIPETTQPYPVLGNGTATALNLTLAANARLTQQDGTLTLGGDFNNAGTFVASGGTVALSGAASQAAGGPGLTRFWSLSVGSANATLAGPVAVQQVLTLAGNLTTNGQPLTLESTPAATALVVNTSGIVVGDATVQRAIDGSLNAGLGYRHYAAPVRGATVASLATSGFAPVVNDAYNTAATPTAITPFPTVYGYDQRRLALVNKLAAFDKGWFSPAGLNEPLALGQGYSVNMDAGQVVSFVGALHSGDLTLPLARADDATAADAGWQFLGNPYPAPLDFSLVAPADRPGLDAALYVYASTSQYAGQYRSYVNGVGGNPVVPVGQGFLVRVSQGQTSAALTFRNSQRLTTPDATPVQRTAETRPLVQLTLRTAAGATDEAYLYFEAGATPGFDSQYDALKLPNTTGLNLSTLPTAGAALAIDGRPLPTGALTVPLRVAVPAAGTYVLEAAALLNLGGLRPYLRDAQLGTLTDLTQQSSYSFSQAAGAVGARFELVFGPAQALAAQPAAGSPQVALYPNPAQAVAFVELTADLGRQAVAATLIDGLGRAVRTTTLPPQGAAAHQLSLTGLASGVYALRLATSAGVVTKRLVVE
ncbi:T9SS type A sorting domain-containing protein [Hymenobacter psoromatis]|uniref:T9SS type A sorting domain-containing protein n=1 Tax=Hymenobacter psoromatis TaxID=1484116 RepID=UPI001CBC8AB2|nr:T9SS type A sorting domain-containing protein [Hymenobacter psoromatis]